MKSPDSTKKTVRYGIPGTFSAVVLFLVTSGVSITSLAGGPGVLYGAAVMPTVGTVSNDELKSCVVEIREQLRFHGFQPAVQKEVRDAMNAAGLRGKPTLNQVKNIGETLGVDLVVVSVVAESAEGEYFLNVAALKVSSGAVRAMRAKLPARGAARFESKQLLPATAAVMAALLDRNPNPIHGPFPEAVAIDSGRLIRKESPSTQPGTAAVLIPTSPRLERVEPNATETKNIAVNESRPQSGKSEATPPAEKKESVSTQQPKVLSEETNDPQADKDDEPEPQKEAASKKKKKHDWKKWDHAGLFGELGFLFSWCNKDGMCKSTTKGYGARIRLGVRIASFVAISFSAVAVDHQMPITTDTEVFLNVPAAFVYAGVFGGLRVHPVRRFPVDPYVGLDLGYAWLLYAENTAVTPDPNLPEQVVAQLGTLVNVRRETIYMKGFTLTPEMGVNFFVAPPLAFGIHVQWLLPFWKNACSRVYNPSVEALKSAPQVCMNVSDAGNQEGIDEQTRATLSKKDELPRFISLELDLTFVFK